METLYTVKDVAKYLRVHDQTVKKWIREGKLVAKRIEGQYRVKRSDLEAFIEKKGE